MKHIIYLITALSIGFGLSSCSSTIDLTINGTPGSTIMTPSGEVLGQVESNGAAKVKIGRNQFFPFLVSQPIGAQTSIPFALDFKSKSYAGHQIIEYAAYGVAGIGLVATGIGLASIIGEGDQTDTDSFQKIALAGGLGLGMAGAFTGMGIEGYKSKIDVHHGFKYNKEQYTNDDLYLTYSLKSNSISTPSRQTVQNATQTLRENNAQKKAQTQTTVATQQQTIVAQPIQQQQQQTVVTKQEQPAQKPDFVHIVSSGETLVSIANDYGVTIKDLLLWNQLSDSQIKPGDKLIIKINK